MGKFIIATMLCLLLLYGNTQAKGLAVTGSYGYGDWSAWSLNAASHTGSKHLVQPLVYEFFQELEGSDFLYLIAHGGSYGVYLTNDGGYIPAYLIGQTLQDLELAFVAACRSMCAQEESTFSQVAEETIGYCGMATVGCFACWNNSLAWQNEFFIFLTYDSAEIAYKKTNKKYPECSQCIVYNYNQKQIDITPILYLLLKD